ncbi:CG17282 [Drosophila busckii]|uniref:CG17282 n=1 Tax=Drosophila busckii TaxID=30019 RepID=A0A0M4EP15_DROBS|nr:peptidyl-prolyl cis-trans isomerase CPR6 [Drosophila busckii]ALC45760.1 CG17282 [Drosophila busckii]
MDWYIGNEWTDATRGLHKKVLNLNLQLHCVEKPLAISTLIFTVNKSCANLGDRPSKYLANNDESQHEMEMGTAVTPIDCYLELLMQQFIAGETSACSIKTKSGDTLQFELKLELIVINTQIETLKGAELHKLALQYKENGVAMYKTYPKFAFDYFVRAAKLLITYKPFDKLDSKIEGIEGSELETLFVQVQTNIAACMLQEKRYEHVIYHTDFVETQEDPSEKSLYRRALAYYHMQEFEKAQLTIERVPNYEKKREFTKLLENIATSWKSSKANYKQVVQRMFS